MADPSKHKVGMCDQLAEELDCEGIDSPEGLEVNADNEDVLHRLAGYLKSTPRVIFLRQFGINVSTKSQSSK